MWSLAFVSFKIETRQGMWNMPDPLIGGRVFAGVHKI